MHKRQIQRLLRLLSQPTAPFREQAIATLASAILDRGQVPHFTDPAGNIVVGCTSPAAYRQLVRQIDDEPVRLFIAHMDHPGFHGIRWLSPRRLEVKWHGGSPVRRLRGARVWLTGPEGDTADGEIIRARLLTSGHAIDTAVVQVAEAAGRWPPGSATRLYGGFRFRAPVWRAGKRLYTKAADDLVGVFAILDTALALFAKHRRSPPPFLGLLTRGEEVGFVGAIAHFELGWLKPARRPLVVVSLETSRALPNALIGHGPVIRLGDRRTVFDAAYLRVLTDVAEQVLPGRHQRRIMDGGTCEAAAATAWGLPAIGISVPLGNYHNEHFAAVGRSGQTRPAATGAPAPEYVHLDDIDGLLKLCRGLLRPGLDWQDPWRVQRHRLRQNRRRYQSLLRPGRGH